MHHRARQRIEPVVAPLARPQSGEVLADELHFLGQQCCAVGLRELQRPADLMQQLARTHECPGAAAPVNTILERKMGVANRLRQFVTDDSEHIDPTFDDAFVQSLLSHAGFARHRFGSLLACGRLFSGATAGCFRSGRACGCLFSGLTACCLRRGRGQYAGLRRLFRQRESGNGHSELRCKLR